MVEVPPAFIFIAGSLLIPFFKNPYRKAYMVVVALAGFISLLLLTPESRWTIPFLPELDLVLLHVDPLSLVVGYIFGFITVLAVLYAVPEEKSSHHIASLVQAGSGIGLVFAGDFFTLFFFWELLAVTSLVMIWNGGWRGSHDAGYRYILMHVFGGSCLLGGIVMQVAETGSFLVGPASPGAGYLLMLVGIGVNAAFILLHFWLPDAYPQSTVTGGVFLCVFTTKAAIYLLARTFPGAEGVAYIGGFMVIYGVAFALLQNDVRKLLSYHIVSQVGYMVAGVGIGTALGINGGIAHLFNHILYKALLFMCMGAVIFMTGKRTLTELGGLARTMPVTMVTCIIAAAAISGVPGFNGFVSKGMVIAAAAGEHLIVLEIVLLLGAVGTLLSFVKLTYYVFFSKNEGVQGKEAPLFMLIPMAITAFCCILLGVYPQLLYEILPLPVVYDAYSTGHLIENVAILLVTALVLILGWNLFKPKSRSVRDVVDLYRAAGRGVIGISTSLSLLAAWISSGILQRVITSTVWFSRDPVSAIQIGATSLFLPVARATYPAASYRALETDLAEMRGKYPQDPGRRWGAGLGVLFISLVFLIYLLVYLAV
jgi:multicomponent Na+:H+ antiporter subunit D